MKKRTIICKCITTGLVCVSLFSSVGCTTNVQAKTGNGIKITEDNINTSQKNSNNSLSGNNSNDSNEKCFYEFKTKAFIQDNANRNCTMIQVNEIPKNVRYFSFMRVAALGTKVHCLGWYSRDVNGKAMLYYCNLHTVGSSERCETCKNVGDGSSTHVKDSNDIHDSGQDINLLNPGYEDFSCNKNYVHDLNKLESINKGEDFEYYRCKSCGSIYLIGKGFKQNAKQEIEKFIGESVEEYTSGDAGIFLCDGKNVFPIEGANNSSDNENVLPKEKVDLTKDMKITGKIKQQRSGNFTQPKQKGEINYSGFEGITKIEFQDSLDVNETYMDGYLPSDDGSGLLIHALFGMNSKKAIKLHYVGQDNCDLCSQKEQEKEAVKSAANKYASLSNKPIIEEASIKECNCNFRSYHDLNLDKMEVHNAGTVDEYYVCPKCGYTVLSGADLIFNPRKFQAVSGMKLDEYVKKVGKVYLLEDPNVRKEIGYRLSTEQWQENVDYLNEMNKFSSVSNNDIITYGANVQQRIQEAKEEEEEEIEQKEVQDSIDSNKVEDNEETSNQSNENEQKEEEVQQSEEKSLIQKLFELFFR